MLRKFRGIVLSTVRHTDKVSVVSLFTDEIGPLTVAVNAPAPTHRGRMRAAALMPLSTIETHINFNPAKRMQTMRSFTAIAPNRHICGDPIKSSIALFTAEFLSRLLRESPPDRELWQFITRAIELLDGARKPANFAIALLCRMTTFAGIQPDTSDFTPSAIFDMREGRYVDFHPPHSDTITGEEGAMPVFLEKLTMANFERLRMSANTRRRILDGLLRYYALHYPGIDSMRSPEVLRLLFS